MTLRLRIPQRKYNYLPILKRGLGDDFQCTGFIRRYTVVVANQHKNALYYNGGYGNVYWKRQTDEEIRERMGAVIEAEKKEKSGENAHDEACPAAEDIAKCKNFDVLQLSLMDAFYLVHVVKCLTVYDENQEILDVNSLWTRCCSQNVNFIPLYVSYHHFRNKGWIVKPGLKFGTDYTLYKDGPEYYHSTYSVIVQYVVADQITPESRKFNWPDFAGLCRITEHVSKDLLLSYVVRPENVTDDMLLSPDCVVLHEVQEALIRRWVSSEERESEREWAMAT